MSNEFSQLNLHPSLVQAVTALGYTEPTPIQIDVIPLLVAGHDVIGQAQTGTGKTAAFALPILQTLSPEAEGIQSLILAPTRELALQVAQSFEEYGRYLKVSVLAVYGGQAYDRQIRQLRRGVDVVVGTPGRLLDLMERKVLDLSTVRTVVLDEADEMLSMGFVEDIEAILQATPATRQTALFSATLPPAIRSLANNYMHEPKSVTVQRKQLTVSAIEQRYYLINESDKLAALTRLFEMEPITSSIIFVRTRISAGELANELSVRGFPAEGLHGDLSQEAREQVLNRFRQNQIKVLVATDVAARGLDIDDISHVFNFDLPLDPEVYVHRIGRTGRAGKSGLAISLVTPAEQWRMRKIEAFTKQSITRTALPTIEEILARREAELLEKMTVWLRRGRYTRERELVTNLVEAGHDPWEVAAAALKVARAEEKQRPIAQVSEVREMRESRNSRDRDNRGRREPRRTVDHANQGQSNRAAAGRKVAKTSHEEGMVRLLLDAGKAQGIRPNDIVGSIAFHADIPGHTIGAIHIRDHHTLVDVPEQFVAQVLAKANDYRIRQHSIKVERA
ncbi:MAG: DEAD/DEAH box helicase [Caldilineaceae bacterium]|nr:DEAD/DEAH box helicase [Caldilineaceae bacterium]